MKHILPLTLLLCLFLFHPLQAQKLTASVENTPFVFVTHVDGPVELWRSDGQKIAAEINLPLLPGDMIMTGPESRCSCLLENGTLVRLDHGTTVDLSAVQTASLTSKWKVTTFNLSRGALQIMARPYDDELLQVRTPMGAFRFNQGVGTIQLDTDRLRYEILSGKISFADGTTEYNRIKPGQYARTPGQAPVPQTLDLPEFQAWIKARNQEMAQAPKGNTRVPKKIYTYSKAVVNFAERWGSFYGEWVYNSLFGYVWKPYSDKWSHISFAPFTNGRSISINGEPFLVPAESWGFIPAHMGNWAFLPKSGWVWIPGAVRHSGFAYMPDADNQMHWYVRTMDLWYFYVRGEYEFHRVGPIDHQPAPVGIAGTRTSIMRKPIDEDVQTLLSRMDRIYTERLHSMVRLDRNAPLTRSSRLGSIPSVRLAPEDLAQRIRRPQPLKGDWNPDTRWATRNKTRIVRNVRENRFESPDRPQMTRSRYPGVSSGNSSSFIRSSRVNAGGGSTIRSRQDSSSSTSHKKK